MTNDNRTKHVIYSWYTIGLLLSVSFIAYGNGMPWEDTNSCGQPKQDSDVWGRGESGAAMIHGVGCMCLGCQGEREQERTKIWEEENERRRQEEDRAWNQCNDGKRRSRYQTTKETIKTPEQEFQELVESLQPSPYTGGVNKPGYCRYCSARLLGKQQLCSRCKWRMPAKYIRWQNREKEKAQRLKQLLWQKDRIKTVELTVSNKLTIREWNHYDKLYLERALPSGIYEQYYSSEPDIRDYYLQNKRYPGNFGELDERGYRHAFCEWRLKHIADYPDYKSADTMANYQYKTAYIKHMIGWKARQMNTSISALKESDKYDAMIQGELRWYNYKQQKTKAKK